MSNTISIRKGLNIRLIGEATKEIREVPVSGIFGVSPLDFHGLTPKMAVKEGDTVLVGDVLFFDKKKERISSVSSSLDSQGKSKEAQKDGFLGLMIIHENLMRYIFRSYYIKF